MRRLRVPTLFAALLLLSACGGEAESLPPIRRHLSMRPPETEAPLPGTTVWQRYDVLRERPDWELIASQSSVAPITDQGVVSSALWLAGPVGDPPALEVQIPGEFDADKFNELWVTVLAPSGEFELVCSLWRGGEHVLSSAPVGLARKRTAQSIAVPVPRTQQYTEPFDNLTLTFLGEGARVGLVSVHLRQRSLRSFLPRPTSAPRLIRIDDEWRAVVGLSSKRPLEGRVVVPADSRLHMLFATPPELDLSDREDSVRISISNDEGLETALRVSLGPGSEVQIDTSRRLKPRRRRARPAAGAGKAKGKRPRPRGAGKAPKKKSPTAPLGAFDEEAPELEQEVVIEAAPLRLESPWTKVALPLDEFEGMEATVRVELVDWPGFETVCAVTPPVVMRPTKQPQTVLLITASALRADHLGAAGADVEIDTALLDQLASRSVLFEDCFAPSNDTNTSLAALMGGAWPPLDTPDEAPISLARRFRQAGFATWAVLGSAQLNPDFSYLARDFDRVLAPTLGERNAGETIDQLLGRIGELNGFPLFIWLHLSDPQAPYAPPENFLDEYYPSGADPFSTDLPELPAHMRPEWAPELRDPAWPGALYRSEITYLDRKLRAVFEHPRLRRGAVIAFTADHGESLAGPSGWFSHSELHPGTLAVPLVLSFPGAPAGKRIPRPVSTTDLGRTLLDLAGLAETEFPGQHLLKLRDRDAAAPRFAFSTKARSGAIATRAPGAAEDSEFLGFAPDAVRFSVSPSNRSAGAQGEGWFLLLQFEEPDEYSAGPVGHALQLFDLSNDPGCEVDVLDEHPGPGRELRALLFQWLLTPPSGSWDLPPAPGQDCTCTQCARIR